MTEITWKAGLSGNWSKAARWSPTGVPGAGDDVTITAAGSYTVTINTDEAAQSLLIDAAGATVADDAAFTLGSTLSIAAGTFSLDRNGMIDGGVISVSDSGGSDGHLVFAGGALEDTTFQGTVDLSAAGATLSFDFDIVTEGSGGTGAGNIDITGRHASLLLYDTSLDNATITLGNNAGVAALTIESFGTGTSTLGHGIAIDQAGLYARTTIYGNVVNDGSITAAIENGQFTIAAAAYSSDQFVNTGTLSVSNNDTLTLGVVNAINTGTISVDGGSLASAGLILNSGTVAVAGTFALAGAVVGGVLAIGPGATIGADESLTVENVTFVNAAGSGPATLNVDTPGADFTAIDTRMLNDVNFNLGTGNDGVNDSINLEFDAAYQTLTLGSQFALSLADNASIVLDATGYGNETLLNAGTITGESASGTFYGLDQGDTFTNVGEVLLSDTTFDFSNFKAIGNLSSGTLTGGTWYVSAAGSALQFGSDQEPITTLDANVTLLGTGTNIESGGVLIDNSLESVGVDGALNLYNGRNFEISGSFTDSGLLEVGGTFTATGTTTITASGTLDGGGTVAGSVVDSGIIVASRVEIALAGAVTGDGTLSAGEDAILSIDGGGTFGGTLDGGGMIDITSALTLTAGARFGSNFILDTANLILGAGETLTNQTGFLEIDASSDQTLTINGARGDSFDNAGTFFAAGAGTEAVQVAFSNTGSVTAEWGTLSFIGAVTNNGTLDASSAGLLTVADTVGGTGTLAVNFGGSISLLAGAATGQTVDFLSLSGGTLDLSKAIDFKGLIDGFGGSDQIDLVKAAETSFTYSSGVLTVSNGGITEASLHFQGSYTPSDFALSSDGHGGTVIHFI